MNRNELKRLLKELIESGELEFEIVRDYHDDLLVRVSMDRKIIIEN